MSSGLDNVKYRPTMTDAQRGKAGSVFLRELGDGFGTMAFIAGVSLGDAQRMREVCPKAVESLNNYFTPVVNTDAE